MFTRALLVLLPLLSAQAKIHDHCKLALELVHVHKISRGDLSTWLCILHHESRFDTKVHNANSKISGMTCNDLKNDDIRDDVNCARIIFQEHQRISGDGFTAWKVYPQHCKDKNYVATFMKGCNFYRVESENVNTTNKSTISLQILPQTEKNKIIGKPSEQMNEFRIMPITKIQSNKNFKPMLHLLPSETDKDE
ncbi:hypothetical protein FQR65_LT17156 [Abscondita terminalis]|nr:hypothetical protein FQR65_LT17156 [Abscondita terminalis]